MKSMLFNESLTKDFLSQSSRDFQEPGWLLEERLEAFKHFHTLPLPEFNYGLDMSLDVKGIKVSMPERKPIKIASVPKKGCGAIITDMQTAAREYPDLVRKYFMQSQMPEDKLIAFQKAFWSKGFFIYLPPGCEFDSDVRASMLTSTESNVENILIVADKNSRLDFIEDLRSSKNIGSVFRSGMAEVFAEPGAQVNFTSLQNFAVNVYNFSTKRATVGDNASVNWLSFDLGSKFSRSDISSNLVGKGSSTENIGLFFGSKEQKFDLSISSVHSNQDTSSNMLTKGVLNDTAKAVYRGLVKMEANAYRAAGYQKEETLLLSKEAEINAVPNLEIDNNDVKCSHGTSIGQVDAEKLFYMMSRGLGEKMARKIMILGFLESIIGKSKNPELREEVRIMTANRQI